jgi:serine/threonine protein kinase
VAEASEEPTLIDDGPPPSIPLQPAPAEPSDPAATSVQSLTQSDAVARERHEKNRALMRFGVIAGTLGAIALQIPNPAPGRRAATAAIALVAVVCAWAAWWPHPTTEAQSKRYFVISIWVQIACLIAIYHLGVFTPIAMILLFGVYFYGLSDSKLEAWTIFSLATGGYAVLGVLATIGVIDLSKSVFPLAVGKPMNQAALTAFLVLTLSMTFRLARLSRSATIRAMSELESARAQIHRGRALLHEARADLDNALHAAGMGRLSGHSVGPYQVENVIGRGATGEVYAAKDERDGRAVALKALYPHVSESEASCRRFLREAEVTSALDSPHIVRVFDTGLAHDGSPYLAMERLYGHDLAWHLRTARRFTPRATLELVSQVAEALSAAQDAGVVHRDLKPQNLFAQEAGGVRTWKVLDFGVSKINASQSTLTQDGVVGTPSYMAPEQARSGEVDHRADVFALGVIAYRALSGRPAFTGEDSLSTLYNVAYVQPARPSGHAELHPDVDSVLALCLAKDRLRRLSSAASFAAALREALRGELDPRLRADAEELLRREPWEADLGSGRPNAPRTRPPPPA